MKIMMFLLLLFGLLGCQTTTTTLSTTSGISSYTSTMITVSTVSSSASISSTPTTSLSTLSIPSQMVFQDNTKTLEWDSVLNATSYQLLINDVAYESNLNRFSFDAFYPGTYEVRVRSVSETVYSDYSPVYTIVLRIGGIDLLRFNQHVLLLQEVAFASRYSLDLYENQNLVSTHSSSIPEFLFPAGANSSMRIVLSAWVDEILLANSTFNLASLIQFDLNMIEESIIVPFLSDLDSIRINDDSINPSFITHDLINEVTRIDFQAFEQLAVGRYLLLIESSISTIVQLVVTENKEPELLGDSLIRYRGTAVVFEFALYGGELNQLTGYYITPNDFSFDGRFLTIHTSFIEQMIIQNPNQKYLMLTYVISNTPYSELGYLLIQLFD